MQLSLVIKTKFYSTYVQNRYKKFILFGLIFCCILFYFLWTRLREPPDDWRIEYQRNSMLLSACIDKHEKISQGGNVYDVFFKRLSSNQDNQPFLPYIGNGYVSVMADDKSKLYLKHGRTIGLKVPYKPFFSVAVKSRNKQAITLDIRNGTVRHHYCYKSGGDEFSLGVLYYAHRTIPSLLVQEISIQHPSLLYTALEVTNNNNDFSGHSSLDIQVSGARVRLNMISTIVTHRSSSFLVLILQSNHTHNGQVKAIGKEGTYMMGESSPDHHANVLTYLHYVTYKELSRDEDVEGATKYLIQSSLQKFKKILQTNYTHLRLQHFKAWNKLWSTGFSISRSLAQDAINGDHINKTIYYLLSSVRHYLVETRDYNESLTTPVSQALFGGLPASEESVRRWLYQTDRCYAGHHTLQSWQLWREMGSMQEMIEGVEVWMITLEKNGCGPMLNAGAEGVMQAVVLSLGGLRFAHKHLEMTMHPRDLHRDLQFRRLIYDVSTHVSISVRVLGDNRPALFVSLDRSNASLYACDAGCLDPPVLLSNEEVSLPVKLTDPLTSILYITSDLQHAHELKHAIHVQSIDHAPAHEHDLLALHRHGHRWGGLPFMFWVVLGALIIIFHLFLFKLVYNEYCNSQELRGQYKNSGSSDFYADHRTSVAGHQRRFA